MARQKKEKEKTGPSFWGSLGLFIIAMALGLVYFFTPELATLTRDLLRGVEVALGVGQFLVGFFLALFLFLLVLGRLGLLWRRRWLSVLVLGLAVWGSLAYLSPPLAGEWGHAIPGPYLGLGYFRLAVLFYLGVFLWAPRPVVGLSRRVLAAIGGLFWKAGEAVISLGRRLRPAKIEEAAPQAQAPIPPAEKAPAAPPPQPAPQAGRLRKVMEGVWKKEKPVPVSTRSPAVPVLTSSGWELPPLDLLDLSPEAELRPVDTERRAKLIEEALTSYGVEGRVVQVNVGPTVTQFGVEPGWDRKFREVREKDKNGTVRVRREEVSRIRVKVEKIMGLSNDLALALAATSIRIEAPVPGKSVVGIEVPNATAAVVGLRSAMESTPFQRLRSKTRLALALGKGAGGEVVVADLSKMPHLLIAGATGSGKTVCLNAVIACLMMYNTPDEMRLLMVDPKRVELVGYNRVPHMAFPVVVDRDKAVEALRWLNGEMDTRYKKFAMVGARNIEDYNRSSGPRLPYLVLVIDELADIMMAAFEEVEQTLCRLAQLARATGIHLVVATQRPSVDVVTGLIKANFPSRLSFAVTSQVDSRTILDIVGAEKLLGRGDMLFLPTEATKPKRLQGVYVSDAELGRLVSFWARQKAPVAPVGETTAATKADEDPLLGAARRLAQEHKQLSASFLQRRLQIGYPRAVKLLEVLEQEGLSPQGDGKAPSSTPPPERPPGAPQS